MKISEIQEFLEQLKEDFGDVPISVDILDRDSTSLYYDDNLNCVFAD